MDRRTLLKNLGLVAGGTLLFPHCQFSEEQVSVALNRLKITAKQEALLAEVVATILPGGELPGAADLRVQDFVWVMVDDCLPEADQARFLLGLQQWDLLAEAEKKKPFGKLTPEERLAFLTDVMARTAEKREEPLPEGQKMPPAYYLPEIQYFLRTAKGRTIQGYMQSEYVMTNIMPYQLVPGGYNVCAPIDPTQRINING